MCECGLYGSVTQFQLLLAALARAFYLSSQRWPLKVEAKSQLQQTG